MARLFINGLSLHIFMKKCLTVGRLGVSLDNRHKKTQNVLSATEAGLFLRILASTRLGFLIN